MSERRQARGNGAEARKAAADPNHVSQESLDDPVYGHVRIWIRGDEKYRIKWTATDQGQNIYSLHSDPQKFADILRQLGIDG